MLNSQSSTSWAPSVISPLSLIMSTTNKPPATLLHRKLQQSTKSRPHSSYLFPIFHCSWGGLFNQAMEIYDNLLTAGMGPDLPTYDEILADIKNLNCKPNELTCSWLHAYANVKEQGVEMATVLWRLFFSAEARKLYHLSLASLCFMSSLPSKDSSYKRDGSCVTWPKQLSTIRTTTLYIFLFHNPFLFSAQRIRPNPLMRAR